MLKVFLSEQPPLIAITVPAVSFYSCIHATPWKPLLNYFFFCQGEGKGGAGRQGTASLVDPPPFRKTQPPKLLWRLHGLLLPQLSFPFLPPPWGKVSRPME